MKLFCLVALLVCMTVCLQQCQCQRGRLTGTNGAASICCRLRLSCCHGIRKIAKRSYQLSHLPPAGIHKPVKKISRRSMPPNGNFEIFKRYSNQTFNQQKQLKFVSLFTEKLIHNFLHRVIDENIRPVDSIKITFQFEIEITHYLFLRQAVIKSMMK